MTEPSLIARPLADIRRAILSGETSLEALVSSYLDVIESTRHLNAFVHVFAEDAIQQARLLDQKIVDGYIPGRLLGAIVSVKDNICIQGKPVSAASHILADYTSPFHATPIERILAEDAILIGTTNCDEFGMGSSSTNSRYGPVRNGADDTKIAGGSSGGAAVSVQTGTCNLALGTDTGGSIRQPAAFCHVPGFKPGYGSVSRHGMIAYASSFDQMGIISRDVAAMKLCFDILKGPDEFDSTVSKNAPTDQGTKDNFSICYIPEMFPKGNPYTDHCLESIRSLDALFAMGQSDFAWLRYLIPCYYILTTAEASSNLSRYDGVRYGFRAPGVSSLEEMYVKTRTKGFGHEVKKRIMLGTFVLSEGYFDAYYTKAQKVRRLIAESVDKILEEYDFIALPVVAGEPWNLEYTPQDALEIYLSDIYTVLANLSGHPAMAIPCEHNGQKTSIQLIARKHRESDLFAAAEKIQAALAK
ncbi:MAG: Asp-tRNA(Asn)/Glu-tRNA(Gln) amidotransferase subunit GatA [Saprospiraceae bacterium]|nr:Asp-tRNA(Asn)/Glu-tRNA(Gln) amidotransferase subunit GatA [Saprospiraceae bacterium]